ncbi:hypothetical protein [Bacillus toyonensis]|uniref:hypothetical protein n=1 Tax=Bacillus toyonensis TaxID=155322 RepID=UPI002E224BDD|nr:hypothetical protein [Bacillus toyonensis]
MNVILKNESARKVIERAKKVEFDGPGREYDLNHFSERLAYINECIENKVEQIVLQNMDLWEIVVNAIDDILELFGYKVDDRKSNYDEHIWVAVKQVTVDPKA